MPEPVQLVSSFTSRQWRILLVLAVCNFLAAIVQSLQAPFYPAEAERKGAIPSEYGFVFGVYELVAFLVCPLLSNLFQKFQPTTSFCIGYLTVAASTTLFGYLLHVIQAGFSVPIRDFLDKINDHTTFIALSFALRILEACGGTLVFIANYTFVTISFPTSIASIFGIMETMFAIGIAAGPAFGGILFQLGGKSFGFTLPFLVTGCLLFISNLMAVSVLPKIDRENTQETGETSADEPSYGFFTLLKSPTIVIYVISIASASLCAGFLFCTLEPHLRQFSLIPIMVGLVFLIYGGVYAIMAFVWGLICDRTPHPEYVTLAGALLILTSFTTIGPVYFLPIPSSVALIGVSLAVFALGSGAIYISAFLLILREAKKNGFPDNTATSAAVTGLWLSSMSLGGFIGPSLGGLLLDAYGFRIGTVFNVGLFIIVTLILLGSIVARRERETSSETVVINERAPLLSSHGSANHLNSVVDMNSSEKSNESYHRI